MDKSKTDWQKFIEEQQQKFDNSPVNLRSIVIENHFLDVSLTITPSNEVIHLASNDKVIVAGANMGDLHLEIKDGEMKLHATNSAMFDKNDTRYSKPDTL